MAKVVAVWALITRWRLTIRNTHALWLLFLDGHSPSAYFDSVAGGWQK